MEALVRSGVRAEVCRAVDVEDGSMIKPVLQFGCPNPVKRGDHRCDTSKETLLARLYCKLKVNDVSGCWEWVGDRLAFGYGKLSIAGVQHRASRLSYELHIGDPGELWVLHTCDNPPCCNPNHLFLGTHADNMRDCSEKRRTGFQSKPHLYHKGMKGEANPRAVLTAEQAAAIKHSVGFARIVADQYGVSESLVREIRKGRAWRHIA